MGLIIKIKVLCILCILVFVPVAISNYIGPSVVIECGWGNGSIEVGLEEGESWDRLPNLTAVALDNKFFISDEVNARILIFNGDGTLFKNIPWYISGNGQKVVNPEFEANNYHNIQRYTPEGSTWIKFEKYYLKSSSGQVLRTEITKPAELGIIKEAKIDSDRYKVIISYPDKIFAVIGKGSCGDYLRDIYGNLFCPGSKNVVRYNNCGRQVASLTMPDDITNKIPLYPPGASPPPEMESVITGIEPTIQILEEYGNALVAPNGDIYASKRTPQKYSIIKWTWQDDPSDVFPGPDAPRILTLTPAAAALTLKWEASVQDPGCVTGYEISRSTVADSGYASIGTVAKAIIQYEDTTAVQGTTYYYKVRAQSADCGPSEYSSTVSGTLP